MSEIAVYLTYSEVFDRNPELSEIHSLVSGLEVTESIAVICQLNAELRLAKRERESLAKVQNEWAAFLLDDETIQRLKQRFGREHLSERPLFHSPQLLNILKIVIERSSGTSNPRSDEAARYGLGTACLMMNDLFVNTSEKQQLGSDNVETKALALMTSMLSTSEVINAAPIAHVIYRSFVLFDELLKQQHVLERIKKQCNGFGFEGEFLIATGISLKHWRFLIFSFFAYLMGYKPPDGARSLEYLKIDSTVFRGNPLITATELDLVLRTIGIELSQFKAQSTSDHLTDWRFAFTPFRSKPLLEVVPNKFFCPELGFLVEKMHSGVYWAINDGLPRGRRPHLFAAWGLLFEEYANWFLSGCTFKQALSFVPAPQFSDGTESFDGMFIADNRLVPMEYKGGFLNLGARYSGDPSAFEADLDLKIGKGCEQLARKIQALFNRREQKRRRLQTCSLGGITRIIPVLVVQDHILRGPLVNWLLNRKFNKLIDRAQLRSGVVVDPLTVVSIHELETMAESAEGGEFDILYGLQLKCHNDPEMLTDLHNFLLSVPGYGTGKSARVGKIVEEQWKQISEYTFGSEDSIQH
jgi:hypothetical protein